MFVARLDRDRARSVRRSTRWTRGKTRLANVASRAPSSSARGIRGTRSRGARGGVWASRRRTSGQGVREDAICRLCVAERRESCASQSFRFDVSKDARRETSATVFPRRVHRAVARGSRRQERGRALHRDARAASARQWRAETAAMRRTAIEITSRFASKRASSIFAKTFGAWRGPFLRRARDRRADKSKLARALATRRALVMCRAFIGWSYRARVVGRSKRRSAADATRHRRAFLASVAFTEWVARVSEARAFDALSDAKLETARAALGATKTARAFDAWLERTKTKHARRAVVTFAERRCVHATFAKTLVAWRSFVSRSERRVTKCARDEPLQHTQTRVSRDGGVGFGRMRVSVTTRENVRRERVSFARRDTASRQSVDRVRRR